MALSQSRRLNYIMQYEDGTLSEKNTIILFQDLVNSGLAWKLQGSYGRTARSMIDAGIIKPAKKKH